MVTLLLILVVGQVSPGPLDAFRANFVAIRADVDYTYEFGYADSATAQNGRLWSGKAVGFTEKPERGTLGRWSYDGATERYEAATPEPALEEARKRRGNGEIQPFRTEPFELLFDGQSAAWHKIKGQSTDRRSNILVFYPFVREPPNLTGSPFCWWSTSRFPIVIEDEFRDARRERLDATVNGFRTVLEIYTKNTRDLASLEVYYDPSIGYLPRYARVTGAGNPTSQGFKELYMLDARPCAAGGFVPLEWYDVHYYVDGFTKRFPAYNYQTVVRPSYHLIGVGHYKAVRVTDRTKPVALEKLAGITKISTREATVSLGVVPDRMALADVATRFRRAPRRIVHAAPAVDFDEATRFSRPRGSGVRWYAILGICASIPLIAACFFFLRRRRRFALVIGLFAICSGCGRAPRALTPSLTAQVTPPFQIYEPSDGLLKLAITVENHGGGTIKVYQASGGCTCRKIDQSALPAELGPESRLTLSAVTRGERSYEPAAFALALSTDRGVLALPVRHLAIPRHNLSPGSVNLGTIVEEGEEKENSFELVQREVTEKSKPRCRATMLVPPELCATRRLSRQQDVPEQPGIAYVDTTYVTSVVDREHGLRKSIVALKGDDGSILSETEVIWQRVPYLSSVPAKIFLGSRPIRAFLRCPDDAIEFTRVLAAPPGIKAVVSSTREVTVAADRDAAEIVSGSVEVGTTAHNRPPLRIPVVRYAPSAHRKDHG